MMKNLMISLSNLFKKNNNQIQDCSKEMSNETSKIRIAFLCNGGVGNIVVACNFIYCFYKYIDNKNILISVYGHPNQEINHEIFNCLEFIEHIYEHSDFFDQLKSIYDVIVEIHSFPDVKYFNDNCVRNNDQKLYSLLKIWQSFRNNDYFLRYFTCRPALNGEIFKYGIIKKKTVLNIADIDGVINVQALPAIDLICKKNEILDKFDLQPNKYITLCRDVNIYSEAKESPKLWPEKYYSLLIKLFKHEFTDCKIVLLGNNFSRVQNIKNADVNLVKKTSFAELKTILKFAFLHVDCECGLVHLREALHGGPSVVLFGPTPIEFFGYPNNINISANVCKHWCAGHHFLWQKECFLGNNVCMNSLKPGMVINAITKYQNKLLKDDDYLKTEIYKKTSLDKKWVADWLKI